MRLAGSCLLIVGLLLASIVIRVYDFNANSDTYSLDGIRNSIEEMKSTNEFVKTCSYAIAILVGIAGISLITDNNLESYITESRSSAQILATHTVLQSIIPAVIGIPIKIGNVEVTERDLPGKHSWALAKRMCETLGEGWRLPTKDELNEIYNNKNRTNNITNENYWCSTEYDQNNKWKQNFNNGKQSYKSLKNKFNVRPVRTV